MIYTSQKLKKSKLLESHRFPVDFGIDSGYIFFDFLILFFLPWAKVLLLLPSPTSPHLTSTHLTSPTSPPLSSPLLSSLPPSRPPFSPSSLLSSPPPPGDLAPQTLRHLYPVPPPFAFASPPRLVIWRPKRRGICTLSRRLSPFRPLPAW